MALTNEQQWFLQALNNFIHPGTGKTVAGMDSSASLQAVWLLARIHTVLPLVYDSAAQLPAGDEAADKV